MKMLKTLATAALAAGTIFVASAPARAVVVTFAEFSAIGQGANLYWKNNGTNGTNNGTGGSLYTISNPNSKVPGSRLVSFSFLQPSIAPFVTNINALFTLNATATSGNPATISGNTIIQGGITGGFSFLTTSAISINGNTFAAGSNLLSGTFIDADLSGRRSGTAGSVLDSGTAPTITYSSDFLSFIPGSSFDFALSLTSITSALQAVPSTGTPNRALRTFKALSTGSFSADPAPIVTAVPEPAVWGLMIVGFGMVGVQARRRTRGTAVSA